MNNPHRLLLIAALVTAEILCAQTAPADGPRGPRRGGPGGPGGPGRIPPVLRVLDADRNGEISAAEIAQAPAALRTLDANADGTVSSDELLPPRPANAPTPPAGGSRPHPVFPVMLALDANADGALSATEIANAPASLNALDADGDGKLTRDELRPLPPVE